jgi:histidyl-tRNA synthetase
MAGKKRPIQAIKGMRDILPDEQRYWRYINTLVEKLARQYNYKKIDTPIVEETDLFVRSIGITTDIVEKEMYSFRDKGEDNLTLRPEITASVIRAFIEHGMMNLPQPVKLFYFGQCFRREKPQAGRYRQFYQYGFEAIGEEDPVVDAQLIHLAYRLFAQLNIKIGVHINSIGCSDCRPDYLRAFKEYLRKQRNSLSELSKKRLLKNPLRILDSKEPEDEEIIKNAPQQVDYLCDVCKKHFISVLEYLDELEVPYNLNHTIVRGLDYYSRTTFEVFAEGEEDGRQTALCGGGRYDGLIEQMGGQPTPAVGFAGGVERFINLLKDIDAKVPDYSKPMVFVAQLGVEARKKALKLFEQLYAKDVPVAENMAKSGLKPQLEMANKLGVRYCLIIGQKEMVDGTVMIRDMEGGIQEIVDANKAVDEIVKRLEKLKEIEVNRL